MHEIKEKKKSYVTIYFALTSTGLTFALICIPILPRNNTSVIVASVPSLSNPTFLSILKPSVATIETGGLVRNARKIECKQIILTNKVTYLHCCFIDKRRLN